MQRIIKQRHVIDDNTRHLGLEEPLPLCPVTVPLSRWLEDREQLRRHPASVGVRLTATDDVAELIPDLQDLSLIALEFGRFTDGRSYSQARLLRERYGYQGELRAVGAVLRDQLLFMERCGMDAFELVSQHDIENALAAFTEFSVFYQPAVVPDALTHIRQRRLGG